jgi:hypothetical protein
MKTREKTEPIKSKKHKERSMAMDPRPIRQVELHSEATTSSHDHIGTERPRPWGGGRSLPRSSRETDERLGKLSGIRSDRAYHTSSQCHCPVKAPRHCKCLSASYGSVRFWYLKTYTKAQGDDPVVRGVSPPERDMLFTLLIVVCTGEGH